MASFKGRRYSIFDADETDRNPPAEFDIERPYLSRYGYGLGDNCIHYGVSGGGNSGFQAVNLAYLLGAKTILLLGFDMHGDHFFGKHPSDLNQQSPFNGFIQSFESIDVKKHGIEIINCSRKTRLTCFPRMRIGQVLS